MYKEKLIKELAEKSDIQNDHLWIIDPDDVRTILDKMKDDIITRILFESSNYLERQVAIYGNILPFTIYSGLAYMIKNEEEIKKEREFMIFKEGFSQVQKIIMSLFSKRGDLVLQDIKRKSELEIDDVRNEEKAKAYINMKKLRQVAEIAGEPVMLSEINKTIDSMEKYAKEKAIDLDFIADKIERNKRTQELGLD